MADERISFICVRSAELRKGKSILELSQSDAMRIAWKELKEERPLEVV
jgi:hypothetical protein